MNVTKEATCPRCRGNGTITVFNGAALRKSREQTGLSLREVARRAKIAAPYLCDIELDRRTPSREVRVRILSAMIAWTPKLAEKALPALPKRERPVS